MVFKPLEVVASAKDFFQDIGEDIIHPVLDIFERYGKNNVMATVGTNVLEKDKIAPNNIGLKDKEKILFIFINTFINDEANVVANMFAKEMNSQSPYVDKSFGMGVELKSLSSVKKVIFITPFECVKLFDCKEDNSSVLLLEGNNPGKSNP